MQPCNRWPFVACFLALCITFSRSTRAAVCISTLFLSRLNNFRKIWISSWQPYWNITYIPSSSPTEAFRSMHFATACIDQRCATVSTIKWALNMDRSGDFTERLGKPRDVVTASSSHSTVLPPSPLGDACALAFLCGSSHFPHLLAAWS